MFFVVRDFITRTQQSLISMIFLFCLTRQSYTKRIPASLCLSELQSYTDGDGMPPHLLSTPCIFIPAVLRLVGNLHIQAETVAQRHTYTDGRRNKSSMHVAHTIATLQVKVRSNRLGSKTAAYLQENGGLQEIHIHDSSSRTRPCTKSDTRTSEEVGTHLNTM